MMDQFKHALFYTALGKYSIVAVQLLVNAIVSRILTPEEFGVVAAVNIFLYSFSCWLILESVLR